ncbi:MAG: XdhC family protein [Candidatus Thiodiazotropha sp. (ex Dulcina madagascariensis)]|nr:XdhC family protein [Candidatus Thiodiazotropha sp. (ex Dulcina madagascariensis)]
MVTHNDPSREQAEEREVMAKAAEWLRQGREVALSTVTQTWGSSPRPPGSLMAMNDEGRFIGSVSGGCVESELISRYRKGELTTALPTSVGFGVDSQQAGRLGLPCGGRLQITIEPLNSVALIDQLLNRIDQGERVARQVCLDTGEVTLSDGKGYPELSLSDERLVKVFGAGWQLLLIGDGQLARYLARMARMLDYRVTICDPRKDFADPDPLPDVTYTRQMPDDAVRTLASQPRTAVVTLAHDPKQDDLALMEALDSNAFYIGALGSTRSASKREERLTKMGFTPQQLGRIRGPAGVPIGSKRPAEIALSIMAEITATRNSAVSVNISVATEA